MLNCLLCYSTPPAFRGFNNPYSSQKCPCCAMSNFELVIPWSVFFGGTAECHTDAPFFSRDVITATASFPIFCFRIVPLSDIIWSHFRHVTSNVCEWTPAFSQSSTFIGPVPCCLVGFLISYQAWMTWNPFKGGRISILLKLLGILVYETS